MATSKDFKDFILEQLTLLDGITCKPMMGEYLLYYNDLLFGGIYDDRFLIKITKSNNNLPLEIPYENAKKMYLVDTENPSEIEVLVNNVVNDLVN
jgi:TfoX/Sxy family transcriptional regulator of competence genes